MYTFPFVPFRYSKTLTIGILILILCLIPSSKFNKVNMPVMFSDVIVHFIMFFVFSAALYLDITKRRANFRLLQIISISVIISLVFGSITELMQYLITPLNRSGSLTDLVFDFVGSLSGASLGVFIRRRSSAES